MKESPPNDWLQMKIPAGELDAHLYHEGVAEPWFDDLKALIDAMQAGDELWWFKSPPTLWQMKAGRAGYAIVRCGKVIDGMITVMN